MAVTIPPVRPDLAGTVAAVRAAMLPALAGCTDEVEHIGSTSVPGLAAKDRIDVQVGVTAEEELVAAQQALVAAGWVAAPWTRDHPVPGLPAASEQWTERLVREGDGGRPANVHLRVRGRANHRYALLFRDYLRTHPATAAAYGAFKLAAAPLAPDVDGYADLKDPVCDLVYLPAEEWAGQANWTPHPASTVCG